MRGNLRLIKQLALPIEYIGARPSVQTPAKSRETDRPGLYFWNLGLAVFLTLAVLFYTFAANYVVSRRYSLELLRRELDRVGVELELKSAASESRFGIEYLSSFAKKNGMVEAKDADSIFEEPGVALTRVSD